MKTKLVYIGANPKNVSEYSSKFWFASLEGNSVVVRFGAIGTNGTVDKKTFSSPRLAQMNYETRVAKKRREGYERLTR